MLSTSAAYNNMQRTSVHDTMDDRYECSLWVAYCLFAELVWFGRESGHLQTVTRADNSVHHIMFKYSRCIIQTPILRMIVIYI